MEKIKIVNMKCGGCANTIKQNLEKIGIKKVNVSLNEKTVAFEGSREKALKELIRLGYPQEGSPEADSLLKKAKSYVSCAVGKMN